MQKSHQHFEARHNQPPAEFMRHSPGLTATAARTAWEEFRKWARRNTSQFYSQFWTEYLARKNRIQTQLDAWENPFVNARQGEPYRIEFEVPACISRFQFSEPDLATCGLKFSAKGSHKCVIEGLPGKSGSFSINFVCTWPGKIRGLSCISRKFQFFVNPDPRTLWQEIPSDQTAEYGRPDLAYASMSFPDAAMWAASRRGRSHAHTGKPRDDAFELGFYNGWHMLAVADGAGSAQFSRKGAELACAVGIFICKQKLTEAQELENIFAEISASQDAASWQPLARKLAWNILPNAAFEARKAILAEATAKEREPRAYATTLLLAMAKKYPGGWAIMSFQVGDGVMAMASGAHITLLAEPDEGEFGGQTRFITMNEIFEPHELMRRLRIDFTAQLEGLVLMTDGVSDPHFTGLAALRDQARWTGLWHTLHEICSRPNPESGFLDWLNFWAAGNHDDRTVALLQAGQ